MFEQWFADEDGAGAFQWFGYRDVADERRRHDETGLLTSDGGTLAVADRQGALVGRVQWFKSFWGPPDSSWCWSIAIGLPPERRGEGIGTAAQRLLGNYLFAHTRAVRIQAWTDTENIAEQRALEGQASSGKDCCVRLSGAKELGMTRSCSRGSRALDSCRPLVAGSRVPDRPGRTSLESLRVLLVERMGTQPDAISTRE